MNTLAERLKGQREILGLSQTDLANAAGCGQSIIGNLESGAQKSSAKIPQIAAVLHVEAMWLAEGKGPRNRTNQDQNIDSIGPYLSRRSLSDSRNPSASRAVFDLALELERGDLPPEAQALLSQELEAKLKFVRATFAKLNKKDKPES